MEQLKSKKVHLGRCGISLGGHGFSAFTTRLRLLLSSGLCSSLARVLELDSPCPRCSGSPTCPTVDTSSEITTEALKEKKEVVEEAENGRDAPANDNANEENGGQEADNEVDREEEEGGEEEEEEEEGDGEEEDGDEDEEAEAPTGSR
ncbi:hypothetical protein ACRRTK_013228 [Alexandromys fortis]